MKLNEFRTPEYSAPTCKTIKLSLERTILGDSNGYYPDPNTDDDNDLGEI